MSLLNCTLNTVFGGTSRSRSSGSENTTTGGFFGRGGGGDGGAAWAVGVGGLDSATEDASIVTTPRTVRGLPTTSSHLPVSRLSPASSRHPAPLGFLPVTQTAKTSSLITQSALRRRLADGRSPNRFWPRNCPRTRTALPSSLPGLVTRSSSVVSIAWSRATGFSSGGPRKLQIEM